MTKANPTTSPRFLAYFDIELDSDDTFATGFVEELKAKTLLEAMEEVGEHLDCIGCGDEDAATTVVAVDIYQLTGKTKFDLKTWLKTKEAEALQDEDDDEMTEEQERNLLQRLKTKYEPAEPESTSSPKTNDSDRSRYDL